jgi:PEP-CTERM motif
MKIAWGVFLGAAVATCGFGGPVTIFNTGQNSDGTVATQGIADPHYTNNPNTVFVLSSPNAAWVAPDLNAEYVGPDAGDGSAFDGGNYTLDYLVSFDLTGFDLATVVIDGKWSTDNAGNDIAINGASTGFTSPGFSSFTGFSISSGFVPGVNTLDFNWANSGGPGGLLVEFTSATGTSASTPEPATITMLAAGLGALAFGRRRRLALP